VGGVVGDTWSWMSTHHSLDNGCTLGADGSSCKRARREVSEPGPNDEKELVEYNKAPQDMTELYSDRAGVTTLPVRPYSLR
jgi:hypothetical protein